MVFAEAIGFTVPWVSVAIVGHFEVGFIVCVLDAFGDMGITDIILIRSDGADHGTGVIAIFSNSCECYGFVLDTHNLIVIDVGLFISPATNIDITNIDCILGHFNLGNITDAHGNHRTRDMSVNS